MFVRLTGNLKVGGLINDDRCVKHQGPETDFLVRDDSNVLYILLLDLSFKEFFAGCPCDFGGQPYSFASLFLFGPDFNFEVHQLSGKSIAKGERDGGAITASLGNCHREKIEKQEQGKHDQTSQTHVTCFEITSELLCGTLSQGFVNPFR